MSRLISKQFYFSVEGYTEKWYLERLQCLINNYPGRTANAKFIIMVTDKPGKFVKSIPILEPIKVTHLCDFEGNNEQGLNGFYSIVDAIRCAMRLGRTVKYHLGYSNLTFDLWIILHKKHFLTKMNNKKKYLQEINHSYETKFETMNKYKEKNNFSKILNKIDLFDVFTAIKSAENIRKSNKRNAQIVKYKSYEYSEDNPDLTIHEIIKEILEETGIKLSTS